MSTLPWILGGSLAVVALAFSGGAIWQSGKCADRVQAAADQSALATRAKMNEQNLAAIQDAFERGREEQRRRQETVDAIEEAIGFVPEPTSECPGGLPSGTVDALNRIRMPDHEGASPHALPPVK